MTTSKKVGRPKETPEYVFRKHLGELKHNNFRYEVEVDYHTVYNCEEEGCDSICRCGVIEDARVEPGSFDVMTISSRLSEKQSPLISYCIERLVRLADIDEDDLTVNIGGGYYGQEIESVLLDEGILNKLIQQLSTLLELTDEQKIKFVLQAEYGYLLPKLNTTLEIEIKKVPTLTINLPNEDHYRKVNNKQLELYDKNYTGIRGVCLYNWSPSRINLIDGYHRIIAAKKYGIEEVEVVLLTDPKGARNAC